MNMTDVLEIERNDGVAILRFNRPQALNALTMELAQTIAESLIELDGDDTVKGIVLTGAGKAFCAGLDLREGRNAKVEDLETNFGRVCNVYKQILMREKPVIAALNGVASGGGFQMALVSDLRVAHAGVRMAQPEINAGIPSIMGSYWMSLHIGYSKNQEFSYTGRQMDAEEGRQLGLINFLVDEDQVVPKACELVRDLAAKPSVAWRRTKARFRDLALDGFDEAFRIGVLGQQEAYAKGEPQQIIDDFLAKRGRDRS